MAKIREEFYHGWLIQVAHDSMGYTFQCWITDHQMGVSNDQHYPTADAALSAGYFRADLETVRLSLTSFLRGKLHLLLLNSDERNALENSIAQYIDQTKHSLSN